MVGSHTIHVSHSSATVYKLPPSSGDPSNRPAIAAAVSAHNARLAKFAEALSSSFHRSCHCTMQPGSPKKGGYRPLLASSMTRLGLAHISGGVAFPTNVFGVRTIVSLHTTLGGVGSIRGLSSMQNTVVAVALAALSEVHQVHRLILKRPSLTTETCMSRMRSVHSFNTSLPLGAQQ